VHGLTDIQDVSAGHSHSLALDGHGVVYAWGDDTHKQLGGARPTPAQAIVPCKVKFDTLGGGSQAHHTLCRDVDGFLWGCGSNKCGQMTKQPGRPSAVGELSKLRFPHRVVSMSSGADHVAVCDTEGRVWTWGEKWLFKLGFPEEQGGGCEQPRHVTSVPVAIQGVVCGGNHTIAIQSNANCS